jgi:hypothetical protein
MRTTGARSGSKVLSRTEGAPSARVSAAGLCRMKEIPEHAEKARTNDENKCDKNDYRRNSSDRPLDHEDNHRAKGHLDIDDSSCRRFFSRLRRVHSHGSPIDVSGLPLIRYT